MFRWMVLLATVLGMFTYGYVYDNPVALQNELIATYSLSNVEYNLLYSIYSIPNILLPFVSGIASDKIGEDYLILFFFGLMVFSQILFVFACLISCFPLMLGARFLFGIGSESHALVETPLLYYYFNGKELAFALAMHLSATRAGSSLNDYVTYLIYKRSNDSIAFALSVGVILLFVSWFALIALITVHRRRKQTKKLQHCVTNRNDYGSISITNTPDLEQQEEEPEKNRPFKLRDLTQFDTTYWLLTWNCGIMYGLVVSWMNIGNDYLQETFRFTHEESNQYLMIPYILAGILQPIWGYISDRIGKRAQLLLLSSLMFVAAHYLLMRHREFDGYLLWNEENEFYVAVSGLVGLGMGYSIFTAVIWPSIALVVEQKAFCSAYGIPCSFYNLILTLFTIFVGILTKKHDSDFDTNKFANVQKFLFYTSVFTVFTSLVLSYADNKSGRRLNRPAIQSK